MKQKEILYLAIMLDKEIPQKSADDYGKDLGLPQSPVYCLNTFAPGKPCVLILDQLDSLHWTSAHSATALDVCKEMIHQAEKINDKDKLLLTLATLVNNHPTWLNKVRQAVIESSDDVNDSVDYKIIRVHSAPATVIELYL